MKIFYARSEAEDLRRLQAVAKCFGIATNLIDVGRQSLLVALKEELAGGCAGLVLDLRSLKSCFAPPDELRAIAGLLAECETAVLLLATDSDESSSRALLNLTGGDVLEVKEAADCDRVSFPVSGKSFSRELSSQAFPRQAQRGLALTIAEAGTTEAIMALNGLPAFAHCRLGRAQVFVWSTPQVFDVLRPLAAEMEFEIACDEYLPLIIFLKAAFREQCWHNPTSGAGIIIDDPLLQKNYGLLDFEKLLKSARSHNYHVTLAFIPWNHWRSRAKELQLFLEYSDSFSICVHGCDHTDNEYGLADYEGLLRKNFVGHERMARHARRTGLEAEALMVCPQEKYSLEAMKAFSDSRQFLALVNTACMPRNLSSPQLTGADLLLPAQDSFFGFPVFKRHYSGNPAVFALDLFLGKPAILVEHHEFFRDGPAGAEEFARLLTEVRPDLRWKSLVQTITQTHARRRLSDDSYEVRFFTDSFNLEHSLSQPTRYLLSRRVPEALAIDQVLVRNAPVPFERRDGFASCEVQSHHPETVPVRITVHPITPTETYPTGIKYHSSVALRRGLSELRDNVVARSPFALKAGSALMSAIKRTRGRGNAASPKAKAEGEIKEQAMVVRRQP
ncbi:MAG: hypothetical protein ABI839_08100 [Verrucomicrobiota bacterium]